jgi:hypothetical protein
MEELWRNFVEMLAGRLHGPLHFRFFIQPLMAVIFAAIDGTRDAKAGKPAYFWAVLANPEHRRELLKDGWKHFGKIFILAIILDVIYGLIVHHMVYPVQTLVVALALAVVPYVLLRGPVNRIVRTFQHGKKTEARKKKSQ